ncbi:MAG: PDZ domain-containing protein [Bacilli bacterium]|nr:PDZ domain-containing protein [Bacilli bacterium]
MKFIKIKKFITKLIIFVLLIIPKYSYAYSKYVIPGGNTIGIEVNSKGVLVTDFYEVNNKLLAKESGFKINDLIIEVENKKVESINDMVNIINNTNKSTINFKVKRNNITKEIALKVNNEERGILKTGLYVKDKINGIGTLSYIDPTTKIFGSLGHEIIESKTKQKFEIKDGTIYEATVSNISKSEIGKAGEKNAVYNKEEIFGEINENETTGIYGKYLEDITNKETIEIAETNEIKLGKATIKTVIKDNLVEEFSINIIKINKESPTKNILFEITDERLLIETGGIVQGMSGSPIIQNNKLIGAVNYVVVNEPKKGYGIFITTMLKEGEN